MRRGYPLAAVAKGVTMSVATGKQPFTIEWDDGFMFIFSFPDPANTTQKLFCGFPHQVVATASQAGTQTQVTPTLAQITQLQFQVSADPATWVETIKNAARNGGQQTTGTQVTFDDSISSTYTAQLVVPSNPPNVTPGQSFTLQLLYSIVG